MLALALLVVVAPLVEGDPGMTQADWHVATCELQIIKQLVVVEDWASRIFPAARALLPNPTIASTAKKDPTPRMTASSAILNAHDSALPPAAECAVGAFPATAH